MYVFESHYNFRSLRKSILQKMIAFFVYLILIKKINFLLRCFFC